MPAECRLTERTFELLFELASRKTEYAGCIDEFGFLEDLVVGQPSHVTIEKHARCSCAFHTHPGADNALPSGGDLAFFIAWRSELPSIIASPKEIAEIRIVDGDALLRGLGVLIEIDGTPIGIRETGRSLEALANWKEGYVMGYAYATMRQVTMDLDLDEQQKVDIMNSIWKSAWKEVLERMGVSYKVLRRRD